MPRPMPDAKTMRKCVDCEAMIPAYGNRKRCVDCQDKAYRAQNSRKGRRAVAAGSE